jgi:hypothetical protein
MPLPLPNTFKMPPKSSLLSSEMQYFQRDIYNSLKDQEAVACSVVQRKETQPANTEKNYKTPQKY